MTRTLISVLALMLGACGGGSKSSQTIDTSATTADSSPMVKPQADQMPPAGDPLWAIPPDRSPLWQEIDPKTLKPV